MQNNRTGLLAALTAGVSLAAVPAFAAVPLTDSHADIGIAFEDGAWDLHIHDEDTDIEYEFDEAFFLVDLSSGTNALRPAGSQFDFIGVGAGEGYFLLASTPQAGLPYIGWATEEVEPGVFDGNITVQMVGARGPGVMSVFDAGIGGVTPFFTTIDGIDGSDVMTLLQDTHVHYNISFSEPGTYEIDLVASGDLIGGGTSTSDVATYTFVVIPEPASLSLLGLGGLGLMRRRR
ncbi:MAG: choice-of-anchor M domain-containing protein [Phycisphaerae bacterium]